MNLMNNAVNGQSNPEIVKDAMKYTPDLAVIQFTTYLRPNFEGDIDTYYINVLQLQKYYEKNNIQYRFINAWDNQNYLNNEHRQFKYVNTEHFIGFPDKGIVEYVYDYPKHPKGHPGKEAHERIAEIIYGELS